MSNQLEQLTIDRYVLFMRNKIPIELVLNSCVKNIIAKYIACLKIENNTQECLQSESLIKGKTTDFGENNFNMQEGIYFLNIYEGDVFIDRILSVFDDRQEYLIGSEKVKNMINHKKIVFEFEKINLSDILLRDFEINLTFFTEEVNFRDSKIITELFFDVLFESSNRQYYVFSTKSSLTIEFCPKMIKSKICLENMFKNTNNGVLSITFQFQKIYQIFPNQEKKEKIFWSDLIFFLCKKHKKSTFLTFSEDLKKTSPNKNTKEDEKSIQFYQKFEENNFNILSNFIQNFDNFCTKSALISIQVKNGVCFQKVLKILALNKSIKFFEIDALDYQKVDDIFSFQQISKYQLVIISNCDCLIEKSEFSSLQNNIIEKSLTTKLKSLKEKLFGQTIIILLSNQTKLTFECLDLTLNFQNTSNSTIVNFYNNFIKALKIDFDDFISAKYIFSENDIEKIISAHFQTISQLKLSQKISQNFEKSQNNDEIDHLSYLLKLKELLKVKSRLNISILDIPKITWSEIGGLEKVQKEFEDMFQEQNLERMNKFEFNQLSEKDDINQLLQEKTSKNDEKSKNKQKGVIFFGPPGTGKTLLAKCLANTSKSSFISVKGPELLNMYVGESEKNMREVFEKAAKSCPCILFFDELDSLLPARGTSGDSGNVTDRLVAQFLTEMDNAPNDLLVIAATNRPDLLDSSILASGKFDKKVYLGIFNSKAQRVNILRSQLKRYNLAKGATFEIIEDLCPKNLTGADFYSIVSRTIREAINRCEQKILQFCDDLKISLIELNENIEKYKDEINTDIVIELKDFEKHAIGFKPSVSEVQLEQYEKAAEEFADIIVN